MKISPKVTDDRRHDNKAEASAKEVRAPKRDLAEKSRMLDGNFLSALAVSLILHLLVVILFVFGLPSFWRKLPEERVIAFEMLPVTDVSNIKTQKVQKEKEVEAEEAKKVQESKPEEKPKEEVVKPEPKPEPKKEEPKKEEPKPEPKQEAEKVKEEPKKEEPKKQEKPKEQPKPKEEKKELPKKKKPKDTDLDSLLKTLEKASEGKEEKSKKRAVTERSDAEHETKGEYDPSKDLSISDVQFINQQIERHWSVPVGAKDAGEVHVTLYMTLKADGTVEQVKLVDQKCPQGNPILCQAMVDSVIRAVWNASPIQGLPAARYDAWKELQLVFTPPV